MENTKIMSDDSEPETIQSISEDNTDTEEDIVIDSDEIEQENNNDADDEIDEDSVENEDGRATLEDSVEEKDSEVTENVDIRSDKGIEEETEKEIEEGEETKKEKGEKEGATKDDEVDLAIIDVEEDEGLDLEAELSKLQKAKKYIGGFWISSSDMTENQNDPQFLAKATLRELFVYSLFLFFAVLITLGQINGQSSALTTQWRNLFTRLPSVTTTRHFWKFFEEDLVDGLHWETLYNQGRKNAKFRCPTGERATKPCRLSPADRNILYNNVMLGVPRIKQNKVRNDSCIASIPQDFREAIKVCFSPYDDAHEDRGEFLPLFRKYTGKPAWIYQPPELVPGARFQGKLASYSQGGYVQNLHYTKKQTANIIDELKEQKWVDQGTRIVIVELTTYNANVNLFSFVTLVFEFPPTGGVMGNIEIEVMNLFNYKWSQDFQRMGMEITFFLFVIYYLIEALIEIKILGYRYFLSFWNILDVIVITTALSYICITLSLFYVTTYYLDAVLNIAYDYVDMTIFRILYRYISYISATNLFVSWIKVLKYLSFNKIMKQFSGTLVYSSKNLSGFSVLFSIIFLSFGQLGYLLLGSQAREYRSLLTACYSNFRTILGDFDFDAIREADRIFGSLFFLTYIFFVYFILINMFLAIVNDSYIGFKFSVISKKPEMELADFFQVGVDNIKNMTGVVDRERQVENAIKMAVEGDGFMTYLELRENLKHSNFGDAEIEVLFDKLRSDPQYNNVILEDDEVEGLESMYETGAGGLEAFKFNRSLNEDLPVKRSVVKEVETRIQDLERWMIPLNTRIDLVVQRFAQFQEQRKKRISKKLRI